MEILKLLLRLSYTFVISYPGQILIGNIHDNDFNTDDAFKINLSDLKELYRAVIKILQLFKLEIEKFQPKSDKIGQFYSWSMTKPDEITLMHQNQNNIVLTINYNYPQFNELLYTIYEAILSSLCLNNYQYEFFIFITQSLDIEIFRKFDKLDHFKTFLENTSFEKDSSQLFCLFNFYKDILFILFKFHKLTNKELLPNSILSLLQI